MAETMVVNKPAVLLWRTTDTAYNQYYTFEKLNDGHTWSNVTNAIFSKWFVGKMESQLIYGEVVEVLEAQGDWYKVQVPGQKTVQFHEGYVGWILKNTLVPEFKDSEGEKIVIRLLPEGNHGFTLEKLGFHGKGLEIIHKNIRRPTGMILATGPTGSGKTTTLYTIMDILNTPDVNISTIEDPVEYRMPRINQSQVKPDIGYTFANGLRSLLRQDPDIIMVGEIRDTETASLAINAALTGHLVFSTLHTNSAAGTLPRLIDMKIEPFLIASTVNVIIAQRLVRTLCKEKTSYTLSKDDLTALGKEVDLDRIREFLEEEHIIKKGTTWKDIPFYKPKESSECPDGYHGRIGIHEVLEISTAIKQLIMQHSDADQIEMQAKSEKMMTMLEDGIIKAVQGITTIEEILRVTSE